MDQLVEPEEALLLPPLQAQEQLPVSLLLEGEVKRVIKAAPESAASQVFLASVSPPSQEHFSPC